MKTIVEHMITMVILSIMVFVFSGIISVEQQIINARNYHTQVIENIQNIGSYEDQNFTSYIEKIKNDKLSIEVSSDKLYATVKYDFDIYVPLLGKVDNNTIIGYSR